MTSKSIEDQYLTTLATLLDDSPRKENRTGVDTWEQIGVTLKADLTDGFPVLTTKKVFFNHIVSELLWFIRGDTNIKYLHEHDNHIWDEWADKDGELGPVYGAQWRGFARHTLNAYDRLLTTALTAATMAVGRTAVRFLRAAADSDYQPEGGLHDKLDQLSQAVEALKHKPNDRRIIVSAWNPLELGRMRLPPCHLLYQFLVSDHKLHTVVYQRSADWFLGVPFNIASYALLTHIIGRETGWPVGTLTMNFGSAHLYVNHEEQARTQLRRPPRMLPTLNLAGNKSWDAYEPADVTLTGYAPHPYIQAPVAV